MSARLCAAVRGRVSLRVFMRVCVRKWCALLCCLRVFVCLDGRACVCVYSACGRACACPWWAAVRYSATVGEWLQRRDASGTDSASETCANNVTWAFITRFV
jgi:hypothetical protein